MDELQQVRFSFIKKKIVSTQDGDRENCIMQLSRSGGGLSIGITIATTGIRRAVYTQNNNFKLSFLLLLI